MRMRKLGNGQSVMYFAPYEVHRKILDVATKSEDDEVEVRDILLWVIYETVGLRSPKEPTHPV
jgi:hypothetical protein